MDGVIAAARSATEASLQDAPTCELQWELERREGVHAYRLGPDIEVEVIVGGERRYAGRGPMTVTVNRD